MIFAEPEMPAEERPISPAPPRPSVGEVGYRLRIDLFDLAVLGVFGAVSVWTLVLLEQKSAPNHIWTGTDGPFIGDQMQYLGWINDAAHHLLISNPFRSLATQGIYFHPGLGISGGLVRLGLTPSAAYLAWKPIAVLTFFIATRMFVRRLLAGTAQRRMALVLALFYLAPVSWLAEHFDWFVLGDRVALQAMTTELWSGLYLWGYPFTALSVACIPLCLLIYSRNREVGRIGVWAPILGLLCAWLQPWQGATLLAVLVVSEVLLWRKAQAVQATQLVVTGAAIALPLAYYSLLSRLDSAWAQSGRVNLVTFPWWPLVMVLAPLGVLALLAYRRPAITFDQIAVRVWPVSAICAYALISIAHVGTFPLHALQGLAIPFAILAVVGVSSVRVPLGSTAKVWIGGIVVALLVIPSAAHELGSARSIGDTEFGPTQPYFITASERDALQYLKIDRRTGAVLSPVYLGQTVPGETGRQTWVGIFSWTPDYAHRTALAEDLFSGRLDSKMSVALVTSSGAKFLLSDCVHPFQLGALLAPILASVHHFGCASVYVVGAK